MFLMLLRFFYLAADEDTGEESFGTDNIINESEPEDTQQEDTGESDNTIEIDGEKYTLDQIKEFKLGHMRQSDYTRKTQELSKLREESREAIELYNYLRNNPELIQKLQEEAPDNPGKALLQDPQLAELDLKIRRLEVEKALSDIKKDYPEANDVEILNIATQKRLSIEDAFDIWKGKNVDKLVSKKSTELAEKITKNNQSTKSMIGGGAPPVDKLGLSEAEIEFAKKLDMTPEEYKKYKNYKLT